MESTISSILTWIRSKGWRLDDSGIKRWYYIHDLTPEQRNEFHDYVNSVDSIYVETSAESPDSVGSIRFLFYI